MSFKSWKARRQLKKAMMEVVKEKKQKEELKKLQGKVAVAEQKARLNIALQQQKMRLQKAQSQNSPIKQWVGRLERVNQKFQNVDSEFGRMGNLILGDMGRGSRQAQPEYRQVRKEGYIHPIDRMMGLKPPVSVRKVKVRQKPQPIQIQVIQGKVRAKKRKPQGQLQYDPLYGYIRR